MDLLVRKVAGRRFLEGARGQRLIHEVGDVTNVLETCFMHAVDGLLLYPENLPDQFFDPRSGEAGEILQKLRT